MSESEATTILANPAPMSSVELVQSAKGPPRVTVKCYAASVDEAMAQATAIYDQLTARYREDIPS